MSGNERKVLVEKVYNDLKSMILNGTFKPGEKLFQEHLAELLGVSRTPLLKAFQILEQEMFLESIPRRGMYVRSLSMKDLINTFECRQAIETTAVRILSGIITREEASSLQAIFSPFINMKVIDNELYLKADTIFHQRLVNMSRNNYLIKMNRMANIQNLTYRGGLLREAAETLPEHLMIISALETKDSGLAEEYMRNHLRKTINAIQEKISNEQKSLSLVEDQSGSVKSVK